MERSGFRGGNAFWSERVQHDYMVSASRPRELPTPSDDDDRVPLGDGRVETGNGRGGTTYSIQAEQPGTGLGCYETPPSYRGRSMTADGGPQDRSTYGLTEGRMIDEDEEAARKVPRTEGVVPEVSWGRGSDDGPQECQPRDTDGKPSDELQRELERAMYDQLREGG